MLLRFKPARQLQKIISDFLGIIENSVSKFDKTPFSNISSDPKKLTEFESKLTRYKLIKLDPNSRIFRLINDTCGQLNIETPTYILQQTSNFWGAHPKFQLLIAPPDSCISRQSDNAIKGTIAHELKHFDHNPLPHKIYLRALKISLFSACAWVMLFVATFFTANPALETCKNISKKINNLALSTLAIIGCRTRQREFEADANALNVTTANEFMRHLDQEIVAEYFDNNKDPEFSARVTKIHYVLTDLFEEIASHPGQWARKENLKSLEAQNQAQRAK